MRLFQRFEHALGSHLGMVFIGLTAGLLALGLVYWFLVARQKRRDLFAYLYRSYYEKAQALATEFSFVGSHKADFFGRQTVVGFSKGGFGVCLIPPPVWMDQQLRDRFRRFYRAKEHINIPGFAEVLWRADETVLGIIEGGLLDSRGRFLPTLRQYLFDKKLAATSREQILLEIAMALSRLHEQRDEQGNILYHGFLLPRSILVDIDPNHRVNRVVIAQGGLAFALGAEKFQQQLIELKEGRLPIEKYSAQELLEQMVLLAPEQKSVDRLVEVGPTSDFYTFGALAVTLLSQQRFVSADRIEWSRIPAHWVPFLQACLSDDVTMRPQDFMELDDWLNDPELALTHTQTPDSSGKSPTSPGVVEDTNLLTEMLRRVCEPVEIKSGATEDHLTEGLKAIKTGKWQIARKNLQKVVTNHPNHAIAHVNIAIACYEMGDKKKAEVHYEAAKKADPLAAKGFRQHLAFRL